MSTQASAPIGKLPSDLGILTEVNLNILVSILDRAHAKIREIYDKPQEAWDLVYKKDDQDYRSPLTAADLESNRIICEGLQKHFPDIPIISEENNVTPYETRKSWRCCWIVDPIDGTKEFVNRTGEFTTNIGLVIDHRPVAGIVGIPLTDMIYTSYEGQGAYVRESIGGVWTQLTPVKAFSVDSPPEGVNIVASKSHVNQKTLDYVAAFKNANFIQKGSSLKFLMCADGNAHIYPRVAPTCEWDTCAAHAIVSESGGTVNQLIEEDGKLFEKGPIVYNKENLLNPWFVVHGPRC